jgi:hypothetical protein
MGFLAGISKPEVVELALRVSGFNPGIDTASTPEDVWDLGGIYPFPSSALATTVVSSSVNDAAAGTGARVLVIEGLDGAGVSVTQTVVLNGTTPVTLATPLFRVNSMSVAVADSSLANEGDIDLLHTPTIIGRIRAGQNRMQNALGSTPLVDPRNLGRTPLLKEWRVSVLRQQLVAVDVLIQARFPFSGNVWFPIQRLALHSQGTSAFNTPLDPPAIIGPGLGMDVRITVEQVTTNGTGVSGNIDFIWGKVP